MLVIGNPEGDGDQSQCLSDNGYWGGGGGGGGSPHGAR